MECFEYLLIEFDIIRGDKRNICSDSLEIVCFSDVGQDKVEKSKYLKKGRSKLI